MADIARVISCWGIVGSAMRRAVTRGALLPALVLVATYQTPATAAPAGDWPMFGQNLQNTAAGATKVGDVTKLQRKWTFVTGGDVSARAAVVGGIVYFPDWGGNIWAVDARSGTQVWGHQLSDYGLQANTHSSTSPAVVNGVLYIGTQEGAWLLAINAANGNLVWRTQLESPANDPFASITASPVVSDGMVYTGLNSLEESVAANPSYPCCHSRGSVVAVNAVTGAISWKTYTVPVGYSGGGVSGSNFVIDKSRGTVFVSTGNNYAKPTDPSYLACIAGGGSVAACSSPDNHVDSLLAIDANTGAIKWATKTVNWNQAAVMNGSDDWNLACFVGFLPGQGNCPSGAGPRYGFDSAPNLITYQSKTGGRKTILGAGQKSGIYYALDPDTGAVLWQTQVGPGSILGGMAWGSASDGKRIYVSIANLYGTPAAVGAAGSWAALNPETGAILWQAGDPNGAIALGPLAVADGVVFASSMAGSASSPTMLALSAASGQTLWTFAAGSSVNAGASIVNGVVYWGSGYSQLGIPGYTGNNKFYAFSRDAK